MIFAIILVIKKSTKSDALRDPCHVSLPLTSLSSLRVPGPLWAFPCLEIQGCLVGAVNMTGVLPA